MDHYQPGDRIVVRQVDITLTVEATVERVLSDGTVLATYTRIVEEPRDRSVVVYPDDKGRGQHPRMADITRAVQ